MDSHTLGSKMVKKVRLDEVARKELTTYFMRTWKSDVAVQLLGRANFGHIIYKGQQWLVAFAPGFGVKELKTMASAAPEMQVALSFREAHAEHKLPRVVLVSQYNIKKVQ